jgi:hypothetical protein
MDGGTRSELSDDAEGGKGGQPLRPRVNDLPTKVRREAEDEMLEAPAAP